jgi:hypothetical protein
MHRARERSFRVGPRSGDVIDSAFVQRFNLEVTFEECAQAIAIEKNVRDAPFVAFHWSKRDFVDPVTCPKAGVVR